MSLGRKSISVSLLLFIGACGFRHRSFSFLGSLRSISQILGVANHGTHATPAPGFWKLSLTWCLRVIPTSELRK